MLTIKQLQKIKEAEGIQDAALRSRVIKLAKLPEPLQGALFDEEFNKKILAIAQKNNFANYQIGYFFTLIGLIIIGEISIKDLIKQIDEECLVYDSEEAQTIATQIIQEIFYPLKDYLSEAHGQLFTAEMEKIAGKEKTISTPATIGEGQPQPYSSLMPQPPANQKTTPWSPQTAKPLIIPPSVQSPQPPANSPIQSLKPTTPQEFIVPKLDGNIIDLKNIGENE